MFKIFIILVLSIWKKNVVLGEINDSNLPLKVIYNLDDADDLFKEFITEYKKHYSAAELDHRRNVFVDNLIKINQWNREQPNAVFGIGPFTDLTYEEFIKTHTGFHGNFTNDDAIIYEPKEMAPKTLDWRRNNIVTRVKNQNTCGSGYIFSAIGNIESLHARKTGQLIELSEQQSLDCNSRGCDGGFPHEVMQALASRGCMRESDYPYENQQRQCRSDPNKIIVRVAGGSQLNVGSEENLKNALAHYGPLAIIINTESLMIHWRNGIFRPTACSGRGQAVLLVGYGINGGVPYWLIKNSWGERWSEGGYFRLVMGQRACGIGQYVASATVA